MHSEYPQEFFPQLSVTAVVVQGTEMGKVSADTRNPHIAGALEIMIDTENRFSGIPTVIAELKKAGMPAPVFIDRGVYLRLYSTKS